MKIRDWEALYRNERALRADYPSLVGVDEAGRGPLAGPLCVAAVDLGEAVIAGIDDSKKLSPKQRRALYQLIMDEAKAVVIVFVEAEEIDRLNILAATRKAMKLAAESLNPAVIVTDAVAFETAAPLFAPVKADATYASVAAASIVAKVARDQVMEELARIYPEYGFERHKGYATREHLAALAKYGKLPIHRESYAPVAKTVRRYQAHSGH